MDAADGVPLGSFALSQQAAVINFTGHVSNLASVSTGLPITVQGGFSFGNDPLDNPATDPPIFGTDNTQPVTPTVFTLTKTYNGPESETVTGPNFPQTYTLTVDVANGQTLTNFDLSDQLAPNVQFVRVVSVSGNGATVITPTSVPAAGTTGGTLTFHFDKVVGTSGTSDAQLTFQFFVPQSTLPLASGGTASALDQATGSGTWTSPNPSIPPQTVQGAANHTLTAKTLAIQKSVVNLTGGSPKPGDTLQYTLQFQLSDFCALSQVLATDTLSDGQQFDAGFTPTIAYTQHGLGNLGGNFSAGSFSAIPQANGSTSVAFDISSELQSLGLTAGQLLGAGIAAGGTGGPPPVPMPASAPSHRGRNTTSSRLQFQ